MYYEILLGNKSIWLPLNWIAAWYSGIRLLYRGILPDSCISRYPCSPSWWSGFNPLQACVSCVLDRYQTERKTSFWEKLHDNAISFNLFMEFADMKFLGFWWSLIGNIWYIENLPDSRINPSSNSDWITLSLFGHIYIYVNLNTYNDSIYLDLSMWGETCIKFHIISRWRGFDALLHIVWCSLILHFQMVCKYGGKLTQKS